MVGASTVGEMAEGMKGNINLTKNTVMDHTLGLMVESMLVSG